MKRLLFGLLGFALLGQAPLFAQGPPPGPVVPGPATVIIAGPGEVIGDPAVIGCDGPGCRRHGHHHSDYVCVPEHYVKETTKWVYCSDCEPLCLCYRSVCHLFQHGCASCADGKCEHPYTRHFLIKKLRVCEQDAVKCVPQQPCCDGGACHPGLTIVPTQGTIMMDTVVPAPPALPAASVPAPTAPGLEPAYSYPPKKMPSPPGAGLR
jgi:hypothetical protein